MYNPLTREELRILDIYRKDPFERYTVREIMRKLGKKSYSWVFLAVRKLERIGLVCVQKRGNSNWCFAALDNPLTITHLAFIEEVDANSKKGLPKENLVELVNTIPLAYFSFIITGSYASGKTTPKSDLDIVVLVEDGVSTKRILTTLKNKGELMIPEVHPYVFTRSEFLQMLLDPHENYGKQVSENRLILLGANNYYRILRDAARRGFKSQTFLGAGGKRVPIG